MSEQQSHDIQPAGRSDSQPWAETPGHRAQALKLNWTGGLTEWPKIGVARILSRLFESRRGRSVLTHALRGSLWRPASRDLGIAANSPVQEYSDIGRASPRSAGQVPAVFITGRFRSGTTLVWNLFRQVEGCTAFYEPLNERRWFDVTTRGERVDSTHRQVSEYWREYEGLEVLGQSYTERWHHEGLYMDARAWEPELRTFIETIIASAPGLPVLQFNRVDFRLTWLRQHFPQARILHVFRHPRDQWVSTLASPDEFSPGGTCEEFAKADHYYLLNWCEDLKRYFPFLDPATASHPYDLSYLVWKLSYLFGLHYADYSFSFEELIGKPDETLRKLFAGAGVGDWNAAALRSLITRPVLGRWRNYADDAWFRRHEAAAEALLDDFFRSAG